MRPILFLFALASPVLAQDRLYTVSGDTTSDSLGATIAQLGDWDGDGIHDWAASTIITSPGFVAFVRVYSGATGAMLHEYQPPPLGQATWYGRLVSNVGDVDGDGEDDLGVGGNYSPALSGYVEIYSSNGGTLLTTLSNPTQGTGNYGYSLSGAGDLNDDGFGDILISSPYAPNRGFVEIRSGLDGASLRSWNGNPITSAGLFGAIARHMGDVDADGVDDYAITSPSVYEFYNFSDGGVFIVSGATGDLIYDVSILGGPFADWLQVIGDADGDGVSDFTLTSSDQFASIVSVHSGATGAVLQSLEHPFSQVGIYSGNFGFDILDATGMLEGLPDTSLRLPARATPKGPAARVMSRSSTRSRVLSFERSTVRRWMATSVGASPAWTTWTPTATTNSCSVAARS